MAHEFDTRQQAEELYILEGMTLDQVASRVDIPARTVEEWSRVDGWVDKRKEYRRALGEIKRNTVLYRLNLLKEAMTTLHPQHAFAVSAMEKLAAERRAEGEEQRVKSAEQKGEADMREISTPQEAVSALQEAIQRRLNTLLTEPGTVTLKSIKELKDCLSMVDQLKTKYTVEKQEKQLLDAAEIKALREQIL